MIQSHFQHYWDKKKGRVFVGFSDEIPGRLYLFWINKFMVFTLMYSIDLLKNK